MNDKPATDILAEVGRALFSGCHDWHAQLAKMRGVRRDTIHHWQSGKLAFGPDHSAFKELLALVTQREAEYGAAREAMQAWAKSTGEP